MRCVSSNSSKIFTPAISSSANSYSSSYSSSSIVTLVSTTTSTEVSSTFTSTSSSESTSSDSSTSTITILSMISTSSTTAPSANAGNCCGVEGYDAINLQVISSKPFTTLDACLADFKAKNTCGSFIIYSKTCYLTQVPITSTNVAPQSGSGLVY